MTFNFNSPLIPKGKIVSIVGRGNSFRTTSAIRMALQQISFLGSEVESTLTIFDSEMNISQDHLHRVAGFDTQEQFDQFKAEHHLSVLIFDKVKVPTLQGVVDGIEWFAAQKKGIHYVIVDDISEFETDGACIGSIRQSLRDSAAKLNGLIYVITRVSIGFSLESDPFSYEPSHMAIKVHDHDTQLDAGTVLISNHRSETPMVYIARSDEGEMGRTLELVSGQLNDVTERTHPELARLETLPVGVGVHRYLLPIEYIGFIKTRSTDIIELNHPLSFGHLVWKPHVHKTTGFRMRYPSFINARNRRKNK